LGSFYTVFSFFPLSPTGERGGGEGEIRGVGKRTTVFVLKRKVCRWEEAAEREVKKIMNQKVRIVIAEDHTILREGLRSLLSSEPEFRDRRGGRRRPRSYQVCEKFRPDLILTDLSMPRMNGMEAIKEIKRQSPKTKVLVLTVHKAEEYILATFRAGANGYLLKDSTHAEL